MTSVTAPTWERMRTSESRKVEQVLRKAGFAQADAYRYNAASIRVRVVDPRFEGISREQRDDMVEPALAKLPEATQADIITVFTFAPSEIQADSQARKEGLLNLEFEEPSPSLL